MQTQWTIKMKFTPLGSHLKSSQIDFKTASFSKGQRSYEAVHLHWASDIFSVLLELGECVIKTLSLCIDQSCK